MYTLFICVLRICVHVLTDINECQMSNGRCETACTNTDGSFECSCDAGFTLALDNFNCEGIHKVISHAVGLQVHL